MLLTITTTHRPATDLGYLLHKRPGRLHTVDLAFGKALMFYAEATEARTTFVLALDIDPVALVRGRGRSEGLLDQYVNDRPYVASSHLSVAMAQGLRTALNGRSAERQALADAEIPLVATIEPCPVRGQATLVRELFGPLGYGIEERPIGAFDGWLRPGAVPATGVGLAGGDGPAVEGLKAATPADDAPYVALTLTRTTRLRDLLAHVYVLVPVLDRKKHYYVERGEVEKLLTRGEGWLAAHPLRDLIARRYLHNRRALTSELIRRLDETGEEAELAEAEDDATPRADTGVAKVSEPVADAGAAPAPDTAASDGTGAPELLAPEPADPPKDAAEQAIEKPMRLHETRLDAVAAVLVAAGCRRVVDLGCGSGKLLKRLLAEKQFTDILGIDVGVRDLEGAARRLRLERLNERQRKRITLLQGALTYRDRRIEGFDAAALVEVIEHLEPDRLPALERVVFEFARPGLVVVTTPNVEYNVRFEGMRPGQLRHADHRFEWTRAEFRAWAEAVAGRFGYGLDIRPLGPEDPDVGAPSQMGVFTR